MRQRVRLLGTPVIWNSGSWHYLPIDKRLGLLTHLVCAGGWVARERLAYLFWPDVPSAQARMNLRQLLIRARALPYAIEIESDGKRLRWGVDNDVAAFRQAVAADDHASCVTLYGGDLVEGYEPDDASEFANWLDLERSQLREAFRLAALNQRVGPGPPGATRLRASEPIREPLTSFVGRRAELDLIRSRLTVEPCRLLTVLGIAGAGKSRLAMQAATELAGAFPNGARFVPLASVASGEALPAALAAALGVELNGNGRPLDQLTAALVDRNMLLVLDQFEHLGDAALMVGELLAACHGIRCLVTSRERLRLQGEWLLPLSGLQLPHEPVPDTD